MDRELVLAKENPISKKFFRSSSMTPLMVAIQPKLYRPEKMNSKATTATSESDSTATTESVSSLSESSDWNSGLTTMRSLNRIFNSSIDFHIPYEFLFPDYHAS